MVIDLENDPNYGCHYRCSECGKIAFQVYRRYGYPDESLPEGWSADLSFSVFFCCREHQDAFVEKTRFCGMAPDPPEEESFAEQIVRRFKNGEGIDPLTGKTQRELEELMGWALGQPISENTKFGRKEFLPPLSEKVAALERQRDGLLGLLNEVLATLKVPGNQIHNLSELSDYVKNWERERARILKDES